MFRRVLNCVAIACAISILPHATGMLHADPEGDCRRECANYVCWAKQGASAGQVAFCSRYTDVFCRDLSDDYCNPDIGCGSGGCEDWLKDGGKLPVDLESCTPSNKCSLTCPNNLPGKYQPALGCASASCEFVKGQPQIYRSRCKNGSK